MKPVWLVAAVALAAFLWWRRRRLEPPVLIAGVIAVVAAAVYWVTNTLTLSIPNSRLIAIASSLKRRK